MALFSMMLFDRFGLQTSIYTRYRADRYLSIIMKASILFLFGTLSLLLLPIRQAEAQTHWSDDLRIGVAVNYNSLHYDSEVDALNDMINYDFGYQVQVQWIRPLTSSLSLDTGLQYFVYRYKFDDPVNLITNPDGYPSGQYIKTISTEDFQSSYLGVPIHLRFRPFQERGLYLFGGPTIAYKVGYSNGSLDTSVYSKEDDEKLQVLFTSNYNAPELADDFLLTATAGLGYDFNRMQLPIDVSLSFKHGITTYMSGDNYVKSWIRSAMVSVSYTL
jgi:hypothetical protein